jgi:hypothetical protein
MHKKKHMKQTIVLAFMLAAMFSAGEAHALSCLPSPGAEAEFQQAQAVFAGEATHVFNDDNFGHGTKNYAKFRVDDVYKGELPAHLTIETDGTWGTRFEAGHEYLVYLDKLGPYEIELCRFGTMSLEDSQAWDRITQIEAAGHQPRDPQPNTARMPEEYLWGWPHNQVVLLEWAGAGVLMIAGYILIKKFY